MADDSFTPDSFTPDKEETADSFISDRDLVKLSLGTALGATQQIQKILPIVSSEAGRIATERQADEEAMSPKLRAPKLAGPTAFERPTYPGESLQPMSPDERFRSFLQEDLPLGLGKLFQETKHPYEIREAAVPGEAKPVDALEASQRGTRNVIAPMAKPEQIALLAGLEGAGAAAEIASLGEVGQLYRRAVSGYFGTEAARSAAQAAPQIFDKSRSKEERIQSAAEALGGVIMAKQMLGQAIAPGSDFPSVRSGPDILGPPAMGTMLPQPPPTFPSGRGVGPFELKPPVEPKPEIPRAPASAFKPEVPETTPEERLTGVEEARQKGANTIQKVLDLFPALEGNREKAREIRNLAFPEDKGTEDAKGIRSDQGPTGEVGGVVEERKEPRGEDIQQPPPGEPEPVGAREEEKAPKEEVKPTPAPEAEPTRTTPMSVDDYIKLHNDPTSNIKNFQTDRAGLGVKSIEDLEKIVGLRAPLDEAAKLKKEMQEAPPEKKAEATKAYMDWINKNAILMPRFSQFPREIIEHATNTGSHVRGEGQDTVLGDSGPRPLDWKEHPEVADWLIANGKRFGWTDEAINNFKAQVDEFRKGKAEPAPAPEAPTPPAAEPPSPPAAKPKGKPLPTNMPWALWSDAEIVKAVERGMNVPQSELTRPGVQDKIEKRIAKVQKDAEKAAKKRVPSNIPPPAEPKAEPEKPGPAQAAAAPTAPVKLGPLESPGEHPPQVVKDTANAEIKRIEAIPADARTEADKTRLQTAKRLLVDVDKQAAKDAAKAKQKELEASLPEKIVQQIEGAAQQASERIKKRRGKGGITFSMAGAGDIERFLENVVDLSIIGASKLARFGLDKARFIKEMRKSFGPWLNAHMDNLYDASVQMLNRYGEKARAAQTPIQQIIAQHTGLNPNEKGDLAKTIEVLENAFKTVRTIRDHFEGGDKMPAAEVKVADDFLEADANKIRESLTQYVQEQLPPSERGRFTRAIANATRRVSVLTGNPEKMYANAAKVAASIESWSEEVAKKRLLTRIGDMANTAMKSSGVDVMYRQRIKAIMDDLLLSKPTPATIKRLESMREFAERMEAQGIDPGIPRDVLGSLDVLAKTPAQELPLDVLQGIHDQVKLNMELGREKRALLKARNKKEQEMKLAELEKERTTPWNQRLMQKTIGDPSGLMTALGNYMRKVQNAGGLIDKMILPIDALMDMLGDAKAKYDGWLFKYIRNPTDLAYNRMLLLRDDLSLPVKELVKKYRFKANDGEIIGVYAHNIQEGGRERMIRMLIPPDVKIPERGEAPTPEYVRARQRATAEIDRVLAKMTPQHLEVYRAMRAKLDQQLPQLQRIMHQLYNIEVHPVENYFPMPREWAEYKIREPGREVPGPGGTEMAQNEMGTWENIRHDFGPAPGSKVERGFTITRIPNAKSAIKMNAFDIYDRHISDLAHLIEAQADLKKAWDLTQTDMFAEKYGRDGVRAIQDWLDTYARQGHMSGLRRWPVLDWFRRRTSVGVIGFRLASNLVHASNIPLGIQRTGIDNYFKAAGQVFSERAQDWLREHFRETFERGGGEPSIYEVEKGPITKASFWVARSIDRYNAQATVMGVYMRLLAEKGKRFDFDAPIDAEAQSKAMVLSRRAIASPLAKDVSLSLSRGALTAGNVSIGRTIMQFQNIFQDQWSNIRHDFIGAGMGVGKGRELNMRQAMGMSIAIAAMAIAEAGIRQGASQFINTVSGYQPKKEEEFGDRIATDLLRRVPVMSHLMTWARYRETGIPILDTGIKIVGEGYRAFTGKTEAVRERAAAKSITGVGQVLVPGAGQAGELYEKSLQ